MTQHLLKRLSEEVDITKPGLNSRFNIFALEGHYGGSHKSWLNQLKQQFEACCFADVHIFGLPSSNWRWRLKAGAIEFASRVSNYISLKNTSPDLFILTSMCDLTLFRSLLPSKLRSVPIYIYMHENQFAYPQSPNEKKKAVTRDHHYKFINLTQTLGADKVFFNSKYNLKSLLELGDKYLRSQLDFQCLEIIDQIKHKAEILPLGLDLPSFRPLQKRNKPLIVWNHRWEKDKNPYAFCKLIDRLAGDGIDFELAILGEQLDIIPPEFIELKNQYSNHIKWWGKLESKIDYFKVLGEATHALTTSNHDFFGISVLESVASGCLPLMPNRLAYPEHFPEGLKYSYLYNNLNGAYKILKTQIQSSDLDPYQQDLQKIQSHIDQYRWEKILPRYKKAFSLK